MTDITWPTGLAEPERRMLASLCQLDGVEAPEALRRAVRVAFFARVVTEEVVAGMLGPQDPDAVAGWEPTGEVRVSVRGDLVAERRNRDGATKWVPASEEEIDAYFTRRR